VCLRTKRRELIHRQGKPEQDKLTDRAWIMLPKATLVHHYSELLEKSLAVLFGLAPDSLQPLLLRRCLVDCPAAQDSLTSRRTRSSAIGGHARPVASSLKNHSSVFTAKRILFAGTGQRKREYPDSVFLSLSS
jgi:hypothetical protein